MGQVQPTRGALNIFLSTVSWGTLKLHPGGYLEVGALAYLTPLSPSQSSPSNTHTRKHNLLLTLQVRVCFFLQT